MIKDTWFSILLYNDVDGLKSIVCVNKLFNDILQDYYFWLQYYDKHDMILSTSDIYKTTYDWIKSIDITLKINKYMNFLKDDKFNSILCYVYNNYNLIKNIRNVCYNPFPFPVFITIYYNIKNNIIFLVYDRNSYYLNVTEYYHLMYIFIKNNVLIKKDDFPNALYLNYLDSIND